MNPEIRVAFALIDTLPRGEYPVELLHDEWGARRLVRECGVTLPAPYDREPSLDDLFTAEQDLPPGFLDNQYPAIVAARPALERGVFAPPGEALAALNEASQRFALQPVWEAGGVRYRSGLDGWGPALAAFTIPAVAALHGDGSISRVRQAKRRWENHGSEAASAF